jgi:hypothetical protein
MYFIITAFLLAVIIILFVKLQDKNNYLLYLQGRSQFYERKSSLLTGTEKKLFQKIREVIVDNDFEVFPQVHLSSFVNIKPGARDLEGKFEWINKFCVDYVLFDKENLSPVLVIELNDDSHKWGKKPARDEFVSNVLTAAHIPLLTLKPEDIPNPELASMINRYFPDSVRLDN